MCMRPVLVPLVALATSGLSTIASAELFVVSGEFSNGYSITTVFETFPGTPGTFLEQPPVPPPAPGPWATTYVAEMTLTVRLGGSVVSVGSPIVAGTSIDRFLQLGVMESSGSFTVHEFDVATITPGIDTYYFASNFVDEAGQPSATALDRYNLFRFTISTGAEEFLGFATSLSMSPIPAPGATALLLLASAAGRRRR